ncbi:hypothetical protein JCM4814A_06490 [Streptomyces phaeofaciens JCM 4814]|uniref:Uncharacterized protein n=1 Tax=Streptomyces phaeofaciens TaxID=68254 RepID=A0A918HE24_9ACTN|nr:hypothetical protein GCM10010226_34020 [Streptomyces phaeofaciens]
MAQLTVPMPDVGRTIRLSAGPGRAGSPTRAPSPPGPVRYGPGRVVSYRAPALSSEKP